MPKLRKHKKVLLVFLGAVLFVFLLYNVLWFMNYKAYEKFIDDEYIKSPYSSTSFSKRLGESTYTVKKPAYLQLTGNIAIDNVDSSVSIIIWPSFMLKSIKDYGLMLYDTEKDRGYMFYVDENMNYDTKNRTGIPEDSESNAKDLLNRLQGEVDKQYKLIRSEFF